MTKSQIKALATELGYEVSESDTKDKMISDFITQQGL